MSDRGQAKVYYLTGDDHADDPAWGIEPVYTGNLNQVSEWLLAQRELGGFTVTMPDGSSMWAADLLKR